MRLSLVGFLCAATLAAATSGCVVKLKKAEPPPPPPPPPPVEVKKEEPPPPPPAKKFIKIKLPPVKDNKVELPGPILFETGKPTLKQESFAVLELVAEYLKQTPDVTKHRIEGHTDTDGQPAANMQLSQARALAVAMWLRSQGIDCNRLVPVGFGQTKLKVSPEKTPDDKATNRRVDFINAELKGKAIGGLPIDGGGTPAGNACM